MLCFKFFASNTFLLNHYKKRHRDYYETELSAQENQALLSNIGRGGFDEEQLVHTLREEVVDRFDRDFLKLHQELGQLRKASQLEEVQELLQETKQERKLQTQDVRETVKTYEILIEEFKAELLQ